MRRPAPGPRSRGRAAVLAPLLLAGALALPAAGYIPPADRLAGAVARANREAERTEALRLPVALHTERPDAREPAHPLATGELLSDPRGRARLELVGRSGVREVHVLQGGRVQAWRDGVPLREPRALLPPLLLLQIGSPGRLRTALRSRGVAVDAAAMGRAGGHDCFVIGGRDPGPAPPQPGGESAPPAAGGRPALWIDAYDFEVVRVDGASGTRFGFGPLRRFGERRLPAWVALREPGHATLYLEILGAEAASPAASDFAGP